MAGSDIARIRREIELEYEAAQHIFTGFTPTARHEYISARQENIAVCFEKLKKIITPEEALEVIIQAENNVNGISSMVGEHNEII